LNEFSPETGSWKPFAPAEAGQVKIEDLKNQDLPPIIRTVGVQRDIAMIRPWLDNGDSFILVGPEGCGKNLLIRNQIKQTKSTQVAVIHCNAQTAAFHVIQKLN
jgi:dynein heavy chain 2